jgi:hypothetical protein
LALTRGLTNYKLTTETKAAQILDNFFFLQGGGGGNVEMKKLITYKMKKI